MAADHLFELDADLMAHATDLEGHPDNVAAALLGGFVICADGQATRFDPPMGLEAVLVVPHEAVRTKEARAALPAEVPMSEAVFNVAHGALLTLGLSRGDWDLVSRGLADRLHQDRRASPVPAVGRPARRRPGPRRPRRDDLRRRADGPRLEPLRADRRRHRGAAGTRRGLGDGLPRAVRGDGGAGPGDVSAAEDEWKRASFDKVRGQGRAGPSHGGTSPQPPGGSP